MLTKQIGWELDRIQSRIAERVDIETEPPAACLVVLRCLLDEKITQMTECNLMVAGSNKFLMNQELQLLARIDATLQNIESSYGFIWAGPQAQEVAEAL